MRRIVLAMVLVGGVVMSVLAPAWAVIPKNGVYQGVVNGSTTTNGHNEGEGYLRTKGTSANKKIVPPGSFTCGSSACQINYILVPSDFACNQLNANLEATSIPVTSGAFDYTGKANIGPSMARMNVHFKGHWKTTTRIVGFTRIWNKSCDSGRANWTMNTPPPA